MSHLERIEEELKRNNGIITASFVRGNNIPTVYLTRLSREGKLKRVGRGIYMAEDAVYDELFFLQIRCPKIVFSYETALCLLNLTDKIPQTIDVTVNHKYKFNRKPLNLNVHYVSEEILNLGVVEGRTNAGHPVRLYSAERILCDFVKNKEEMDPEVYFSFVKAYPNYEDKDLNKLFYFAQKLDVFEELREVMELVQ